MTFNPFAPKPPSESEVTTAVRAAVAENHEAESIIDGPIPEVIEAHDTADRITGQSKLSKLIDDDFPFDESQLDAIDGLSTEQYACLTGAAGTGKTTTTKKIVDTILESEPLDTVNMESYWKAGVMKAADDDYEAPEKWVPSVVLCAFTGRATQMIKKNFPRDWHGNIMTIHRMLGYMPEFYEDWDEETGSYRKKMRFIPTYNSDFKMPWDIIIVDEAGMLGIDLWEEVYAAMKPGCRVIMIGDINQLPPVHGKSVFGYAMSNWPSWELTHVHRQQGVNNPIVDNAWRILNGRMPQSEGRFQMIPLKGDAALSNRKLRAIVPELRRLGVYDPIRDSIITPINGEDGSRGFQLGQIPLNREFALMFNPQSEHPRYIIDGGRERKQFAVGDKVMATKNDWEAGITNGMTGVIQSIEQNGGYSGEHRLFGRIEDVNAYAADDGDGEHVEFTLDDLSDSMDMIEEGNKKKKESRERGPSSHIVTVRFGDGDSAIEVPFASLSEVGSLQMAYVVTCHKMQGGEAPTILVICHDSHRSMLYREWLYTAVTRASEKCILLYSDVALKTALNKQKMPGATLKQKVMAFNALQEAGSFARVPSLPISDSTRNRIMDREDTAIVTDARLTTDKERAGGLMALIQQQKGKEQPKPDFAGFNQKIIVEHRIKVTEHRIIETPAPAPKPEPKDGGDLTPHKESALDRVIAKKIALAALPAPPPPPVLVSQWGAAQVKQSIDEVMDWSKYLLTHQPTEKAQAAQEKLSEAMTLGAAVPALTKRPTFSFGVK
jgi:hypothetical protein